MFICEAVITQLSSIYRERSRPRLRKGVDFYAQCNDRSVHGSWQLERAVVSCGHRSCETGYWVTVFERFSKSISPTEIKSVFSLGQKICRKMLSSATRFVVTVVM